MRMTAGEEHYHPVTRRLLRLFRAGRLDEVAAVEVEPEYGHVAKVTYRDGTVRVTKGSDVGLNSAAAYEVAGDKAYTKYLLERAGFRCPRGRAFLLPWWAEHIRPGLAARGFDAVRETGEIPAYAAAELGFPVYLKPADGAQGVGVRRCADEGPIPRILDEYARERVRVAIVEEAVPLPDHRLVVLDGRLVAAYTRTPLSVTGDGVSPVGDLLAGLWRDLAARGREIRQERVQARLEQEGRRLSDVPRAGEVVRLLDVSNLSAGGGVEDLTADVAPRWADLAAGAARCVGLRLCGVDLACPDLRDAAGDHAVLEVNANPGLDHYAATGPEQERLVDGLYATIFNTPYGV